MDILKTVMYLLHGLISLTLIGLVVMQTSRSEGLGAVGGSSSPTSRGRQGVDEQLAQYTKWVAGAFMLMSIIIYMLSMRFNWS